MGDIINNNKKVWEKSSKTSASVRREIVAKEVKSMTAACKQ